MIAQIARAAFFAAALSALAAGPAAAATAYDGRWSLSIETDRGSCSTYHFPVDIVNGRVSFPGLVRASGRVTAKGFVRVFVAVTGKSASGSGKLTRGYGAGRWSGRSGDERCSGRWTAYRA